GVAESLGQEGKDLELAIGQPLRIRTRPCMWSTGKVTRAPRVEPPSGDLGGWRRAETLEESQRLALSGLVAIQAREGLLVGAADLLPGVRRGAPVARNLQGVGGGRLIWRVA